MAKLVITIDGPAASGKSTIARNVAERLSASFLDTGAMYRAVTLAAIQAAANFNDEEQLLSILNNTEFTFGIAKGQMSVAVNGQDVTEQIREPEVTANVHYIASAGKLRARLVDMQRQFAADQERVITEGRDQGTVAFADADVKFYLTASAAERAKRRQAELKAKGIAESIEQIQDAIEERDRSDEGRDVGPLKAADDAIAIDTTNMSIDEVVETVLNHVKKKCTIS